MLESSENDTVTTRDVVNLAEQRQASYLYIVYDGPWTEHSTPRVISCFEWNAGATELMKAVLERGKIENLESLWLYRRDGNDLVLVGGYGETPSQERISPS